jgi:periplasmic divalent cation tolerance protein
MSRPLLVYITAADPEEASRIARALTERRLAAGVNIFGPLRSVYRWKGKIHSATESALIVKTRSACFAALTRLVRELHSYETPCIVALPLVRGDAAFLRWIGENTLPEGLPRARTKRFGGRIRRRRPPATCAPFGVFGEKFAGPEKKP